MIRYRVYAACVSNCVCVKTTHALSVCARALACKFYACSDKSGVYLHGCKCVRICEFVYNYPYDS